MSRGTQRETYDATRRPDGFGLTPELIPNALDIIHAVENHHRIPTQRPFGSRKRNPAGHLLRPCMIVHAAGRICCIVRRDSHDLVAWVRGGDGAVGEQAVLGLLQEGMELGCTVGEA